MIILNDEEVKFGEFPNKELNLPIQDLKLYKQNEIKFIYEEDRDLIKLLLLKNYLFTMGYEVNIYFTYLPYSRMDRPNGFYSVGLHAICELINSMDFNKVVIREPHSKESSALIKNFEKDEWCLDRIEKVLKLSNSTSLFFPDYGALTRYGDSYNGIKISHGKKKRDFNTGEIIGLEILGEVTDNVLIVDDICSRGGTFIEASKKLKEKGVKRINLLVAYCEDNVFNGDIFDYVDNIYTSTERELKNHPRIIKIN